ncbi:MAG TPA: methylmalonyl-CoA mutase family protein [Chryseosolibacter sp.]|nr:methylmalonyl-CoA mutase family protein [Chryseosolibacter sp.]
MSEIPINKLLAQTFPKSNKDEWKKIATSELNGNEPFNQLTWKIQDELGFLPYYDKQILQDISLRDRFIQRSKKDSFLGNRAWYNQPMVSVTSDAESNKSALEHLKNGADGVLFNLRESQPDLSKLLNEIEPEYCALSFSGVTMHFAEKLHEYFSKRSIASEKLSGAFFWGTLPSASHPVFAAKEFKSTGIQIPSGDPLNEIQHALIAGVNVLNTAKDERALSTFANSIAFSLESKADFLTDIAKLKTLRLLWFQVVMAYGIKNFAPEDIHIHVTSSPWIKDEFQPHGNMLKATTSAMAAIIGGCDALTVLPEDENNPTMDRIARNVSSVLREESHFDKVSDPLAGSYIIEAMIDQMAQEAWSMFQKNLYANVEA